MEESVECARWKKTSAEADAEEGREGRESTVGREEEDGQGGAEHWQKKYLDMCEAVKKRDRELAEVRLKVVQALKEPRGGS